MLSNILTFLKFRGILTELGLGCFLAMEVCDDEKIGFRLLLGLGIV